MLESGYRCAICKTVEPLEIEHIEEFSKVNEHSFENMIVLCANCHRRKEDTSNPRHINTASLKKIKQDLMLLNGRYSDLEKRIIEDFKNQLSTGVSIIKPFYISIYLKILISKLIEDNIVKIKIYNAGMRMQFPDGVNLEDHTLQITLTEQGVEFIKKLG